MWITQRSEFASGDVFGKREGVATEHMDVFVAQWRQPRRIFWQDGKSFGTVLVQRCVHVDGVPEHDEVDDKAERAELIFLAITVTLPEFVKQRAKFKVDQQIGENSVQN